MGPWFLAKNLSTKMESGERPGTPWQHMRMAAMHCCMAFSSAGKPTNIPSEEPATKKLVPAGSDVAREEWRSVKGCVIFPINPVKEAWDIGILLFILYSSISIPIRVCFGADATGNIFIFEAVMSGIFVL